MLLCKCDVWIYDQLCVCVIRVTRGNLQSWDENRMHEIFAETFLVEGITPKLKIWVGL